MPKFDHSVPTHLKQENEEKENLVYEFVLGVFLVEPI